MKIYDAYAAVKSSTEGVVCISDQKGLSLPILLDVLKAEYGRACKIVTLDRAMTEILVKSKNADDGEDFYMRLDEYAEKLTRYRFWCVTEFEQIFGRRSFLAVIGYIAKRLQGRTVVLCTDAGKRDAAVLGAYCKTKAIALESSYLTYLPICAEDQSASGMVLARSGGLFYKRAQSGRISLEDYEGFYGTLRMADRAFAKGRIKRAYAGYMKARDYQKNMKESAEEEAALFVRFAGCRIFGDLGGEEYRFVKARARLKRLFAEALPAVSRGARLQDKADYRTALALMLVNEAL